jgi:hypothetical protein
MEICFSVHFSFQIKGKIWEVKGMGEYMNKEAFRRTSALEGKCGVIMHLKERQFYACYILWAVSIDFLVPNLNVNVSCSNSSLQLLAEALN